MTEFLKTVFKTATPKVKYYAVDFFEEKVVINSSKPPKEENYLIVSKEEEVVDDYLKNLENEKEKMENN